MYQVSADVNKKKNTFFKNNLTDLKPLNSSAFFSSYAQF